MEEWQEIVTIVIFVFVWLNLIKEDWKLFNFGRTLATTMGAVLLVFAQVINKEEAHKAISLDTLILLFGCMIIASYAEDCGILRGIQRLLLPPSFSAFPVSDAENLAESSVGYLASAESMADNRNSEGRTVVEMENASQHQSGLIEGEEMDEGRPNLVVIIDTPLKNRPMERLRERRLLHLGGEKKREMKESKKSLADRDGSASESRRVGDSVLYSVIADGTEEESRREESRRGESRRGEEDKDAQERAEEKRGDERSAVERSVAERGAVERSAVEKIAMERSTVERSVVERGAVEKRGESVRELSIRALEKRGEEEKVSVVPIHAKEKKKCRALKLPGRIRFLVNLMLISSFSSALLTNDTACILLTRVVLKCALQEGWDPKPFLIALCLSSNIGATLTPIGSPQAMIIASVSGLSFIKILVSQLLPCIIALVLNFLLLLLFFKKQLLGPLKPTVSESPTAEMSPLVLSSPVPTQHMSLELTLTRCIVFLFPLLIIFYERVGLSWCCFFVSILLCVINHKSGEKKWNKIDLELLIFFSALFIVMHAFQETGLPMRMWQNSVHYIHLKNAAGLLAYLGFVLLFSNLISNVPLVLLLAPMMNTFPTEDISLAWYLLQWASTISGNLTLVGSVANLIVVKNAAPQCKISFFDHFRVAFPSTILCTLLGGFIIYTLHQ